jgi:hypothetical protein
VRRAQEPGDQLGVGDGGQFSAAAVAGRARLRAGARRADIEETAGVQRRNAAAAGADRDHIQGCRADWKVVYHEFLHDARLEQGRNGDIRAGPAHVDRDDVRDIVAPCEPGRGLDAGSRTGQQHADRIVGRGIRRHDSAIGLHDLQAAAAAAFRQSAVQPFDVVDDDRRYERVDDCRHGPLVFAKLRRNPAGAADARAWAHRQH